MAALLAFLAACGQGATDSTKPAPDAKAAFLVGRWSGELHQAGLRPFRVHADIRSLEPTRRNVVSYTGIDCSGRWTYVGARGAEHRFREVIDRGRGGRCKGVGEVALRRQADGRLRYLFRGGGVESQGVLVRRR